MFYKEKINCLEISFFFIIGIGLEVVINEMSFTYALSSN